MPELPEVETIVRGLQGSITGQKIISATLSGMKMRAREVVDFTHQIIGKSIISVARRAKYIIIKLDDNSHIIIHLGMSGKILVGNDIPKNRHDHAIINLSESNLVFNDPRRFGIICYSDSDINNLSILKNLGIEPLSDEFNEKLFLNLISKSKAPIKSLIMNANLIVGVGNIYACESLFEAGIHPLAISNQISAPKARLLVKAIKQTLEAAILSGGSTLRDYVRSNGDVGGFQHNFKVYGRHDKICFKCTTLISVLRLAGRSTFYCPTCQNNG